MSSGESRLKMQIEKDKFLKDVDCGLSMRKLLDPVDQIISLRDLNRLTHGNSNAEVHISMVKTDDFIHLLRQVPDHRGARVYEKANIHLGKVDHMTVRNYQTFVQMQKVVGIYHLHAFFDGHDYRGVVGSNNILLVRADVGDATYAAFYVPPIIEVQDKEKIRVPLERLIARAKNEPVVKLPGYDNNGDVRLQPIIEDWERMLESSQRAVLILKDGTHRSYCTALAGHPIQAIIIDESASDMQSVPVATKMLVITDGKPQDRSDRFLGMRKLENDQWIGWTDLGRIGIDG